MAYEKQTWTTGEVITQEKLNHMEDGIANAGGGALIVNATTTTSESGTITTLDKTWQEIHDAFLSVPVIIHKRRDDGEVDSIVTLVVDGRPENGVELRVGTDVFGANDPTDYPWATR